MLSIFQPKNKGKKAESVHAPSNEHHAQVLHDQMPTIAQITTKLRLSFMAVAILDALGSPLQSEHRDQQRVIDEMLPHPTANHPAGYWTDDTSMMLCIAMAFASSEDPENCMALQIQTLREWKNRNYLSSTGVCFDLKSQVREAIDLYTSNDTNPDFALHLIRSQYGGSRDEVSGNASLSRILPIAFAFWSEPDIAKLQGRLSSEITHPSDLCKEVSQLFGHLIALILEYQNAPQKSRKFEDEPPMSKLTLLEEISKYPYIHERLRLMLTLPFGLERPQDTVELEQWYYQYHPLLKLITNTQTSGLSNSFPYAIPTSDDLPSTDFAYDTAVSALYCFFATSSFEHGALMAVNLCGEASAVGTVYASLAGVWYAGEEGDAEGVFWTKRMRQWKASTQKLDTVDAVARKMNKIVMGAFEGMPQ
ncbi:ADP-ribosylglycohydrolase-domain-containing protein [Crepidotus variabilis]|uniref:ADP-ribosylhydrolase ARH3 n=1 Tax=Crepidotus variabilis TaxID=179855 RepID=A0A9P6JPA4_9AGAR|nr:ADP-ribosylglycohydrolase-domain-containing protein [Crepidotus variabilis]